MDPDDRRAVRVFITEAESTIMKPAFEKLRQLFDGLIDHLGEENSKTLLTLLAETERYLADGMRSSYFAGLRGPATDGRKEMIMKKDISPRCYSRRFALRER